jgi:hypothetical protein
MGKSWVKISYHSFAVLSGFTAYPGVLGVSEISRIFYKCRNIFGQHIPEN